MKITLIENLTATRNDEISRRETEFDSNEEG